MENYNLNHYIGSIGSIIMKKPFLVISTGVVFSMNSIHNALLFLVGIMAIDYLTGVLASYFKHREEKLAKPNEKLDPWFSSNKTKRFLIKFITYALFIILTYGIEKIFMIKTFKFESYTHLEMSITLGAVVICIAIDFYSIFWENLPTAGFNIPGSVVKISKSVWGLLNNIKNK